MTPTRPASTRSSTSAASTPASAWPGRAAQEAEREMYRSRWPHSGGCLASMGPDPDDEREAWEWDFGRTHFGHGWT
jgi:hypothetical protein